MSALSDNMDRAAWVINRILKPLFIFILFCGFIYGMLKLQQNSREADSAYRTTCSPYMILSTYTHKGIEYVVCGNREIREVQ